MPLQGLGAGCGWRYFDASSSVQSKLNSIAKLKAAIRIGVHSIICGDFQFVSFDHDRLNHKLQPGKDTAHRCASSWKNKFHNLVEFDQQEFTCRNSNGFSKIDRAYTSLWKAVCAQLLSACNLLVVAHGLSDHAPLSFCFHELVKIGQRVPVWVTKEDD